MFSSWYQLKAILWKNWLQKRAHFFGFLAELFLPVLFMALLILIKSITNVYDSPNVAYFCGNTYPWYYASSIDPSQNLLLEPPFTCSQKPSICTTSNYYQNGYTYNDGVNDITSYSQYGYIETPVSSGVGTDPFYAFTVGDTSSIYKSSVYGDFENPSLPFCSVLKKIQKNRAILAIAPSNSGESSAATDLQGYLLSYCNSTSLPEDYTDTIIYFDSEDDLNSYMTDKDYDDTDYGYGKVAFGLVVNSANVAAAQWDYSIRVNYTSILEQDNPTVACLYGGRDCNFRYSIPTTKYYTFDLFKPQRSDYLYGYTYSGFSTLQQVVDQYIFSFYNSIPKTDIKASLGLMPTGSFKSDDFQFVISSTLGIFYMLSFLYPVSRLIRALVLEKECRIKEGMKMMGLTDTVYNLSWLITTVLQMTVVSILITLVTGGSVFEYSNKVYVFIYFEIFSLAVINMCFLLATFFSRSKTASLLGPMIFFATFFPYYAVNDPQFDTSSKTGACLLAPACFALGANVFADYEGGLVGIQSSNVDQETSNFTYNLCVGMLFFDAVLYGVLAWYFDKVIPSEFGTSLPFYFPLLPSYWFGNSSSNGKFNNKYGGICSPLYALFGWGGYRTLSTHDATELANTTLGASATLGDNLLEDGDEEGDVESSPGAHAANPKKRYFETVPAELRQQIREEKCVSIRSLRKVFKNPAGGDDRIAVANLNLDMYQNQVTVLLGHNGAGKTTTISMLVGMTPPTSGTATMPGGMKITENMPAIRKCLGVCPQHDILFAELTALQHLQVFAAFKGVTPSKVNEEAQRMLAEVGLKEKANSKSTTLSGGQKRKLSLGIALIGDSKVVILDEPTSGMDPYSRRSTWNIIQRNKKGRVILLTTHFMDEADLLGDRVAIMAHGKLQCVGSPLFLKNRFGVGYTLTIVKLSQAKVETERLQAISQSIKEMVVSFIPEAELLSDVGAEQSFRLPFSASNKFVELFQAFDGRKVALGIAEYGISVTTLEEVFIRVGDLENDISAENEGTPVAVGNPVDGDGDDNDGPNMNALHADLKAKKGEDLRVASRDSITNLNNTFAGSKEDDYNHDDEVGPVFWKHFKALLIKRAIYAKRDTRMIICQLILPVLLVIIGLSILLIEPSLEQPDLVLSSSKYNTDLSASSSNFVPILTDNSACTTCEDMVSRFNGNNDNGVGGVAVPVTLAKIDPQEDAFAGCALGANPLYNMSQYLILTPSEDLDSEDGSSIYGAVTLSGETNTTNLVYNVLVNGSAVHGVGVYVNEVHQSYLQVISGVPTAKITAHNHPLPQTFKQSSQSAAIDAFVVSLFCMIAFCFVPASFAVFVVKEREVKAKHQQVISGVSIYAYWISTYLWDVVSYMPTAVLIICVMYAYGIDAYTKGDAASALALLLIVYGPATAAITYLLSYLFVSHSTAQVAIMFFNFVTGLCLSVVSFVLTTIPSTSEISISLRYFFRLFPAFCLGDGIAQLALCSDGKDCPTINADGYNFETLQGPFSWDIAGGDIVFLTVELVVYFILAVIIEYLLTFPSLLAFLYRVEDPGLSRADLADEDPDVSKERERVSTGGANDDIVRIDRLRKVYPANSRSGGIDIPALICPPKNQNVKVAVQSLSFGIPKGECFGFLGINGAGKTTTLSILSGEFPPTTGQAFIDGFSIASDQSKIRRKIGYCPQFDALLELLTVREHLELYGRIKGLEGDRLERLINRKLDQLNLRDFENKTAGSLSGGNKRKLSVAVATIGDPSIVFLDEPSTGMDPVARRFMWKVIARMSTQDAHCSVILTTHSMEEAEALCTRIGVMVNGRLRCLGSAQHLKHRYGNGFEVNIKILSPTDENLLATFKTLRDSNVVPAFASTMNPMNGGRSVSVDKTISPEALDKVRFTSYDFAAISGVLGNPTRIAEIAPYASGALIHEAIQGEGSVTARLFLDWWLSEDSFVNLRDFMDSEFAGRAILLERSGALSCRYRIRRQQAATIEEGSSAPNSPHGGTSSSADENDNNNNNDGSNALSEIFAKIENRKEFLRVQEYSVGQTTLEQIFNQFASQQDNPEVAMMNRNEFSQPTTNTNNGPNANNGFRSLSTAVRLD